MAATAIPVNTRVALLSRLEDSDNWEGTSEVQRMVIASNSVVDCSRFKVQVVVVIKQVKNAQEIVVSYRF